MTGSGDPRGRLRVITGSASRSAAHDDQCRIWVGCVRPDSIAAVLTGTTIGGVRVKPDVNRTEGRGKDFVRGQNRRIRSWPGGKVSGEGINDLHVAATGADGLRAREPK